MFSSGDSVASGPTIGADICIVGAGPAGIVIAQTLAATGVRILMLESGGVGYEKSLRHPVQILKNHLRGAQSLSAGETRGQPYTMLRFARARAFGGSTNALMSHGLQTRPLDPIDFEVRDGFEHSGWPISRTDLDPFYARAEVYCGLGDGSWDPTPWQARTETRSYDLPAGLETTVYRFAPGGQFSSYATAFEELPNVEVVTGATLVKLRSDSDTRVRSGEVRTLDGNHFSVDAERFVLATGALENARMLLSSTDRDPRGLGNHHDLVGRFFMEHPEVVVGFWRPTPEAAHDLTLYGRQEVDDQTVMGQLRLSDSELRSRNLLNGTFELNPSRRSSNLSGVRAAKLIRRTIGARTRVSGTTSALFSTLRHFPDLVAHARTRGEVSDYPVVAVEVMAEQEPNFESRVLLGERRDRLGMPVASLDWRLTRRDFDSIRRSTDVVAAALGSDGMGRFEQVLPEERENSKIPVFGNWHHIGTTRMHDDPAQGVVDANSRVHGLDNLYVAGSSVFATGGCSNPTLTLVALALRLADHLVAEGSTSAPIR